MTLAGAMQSQHDKLVVSTLRRTAAAWRHLDTADLTGTWRPFTRVTLTALTAAQRQAAADAGDYIAAAADADGITPADHTLVPEAFAGVASDGRPLETLLLLPMIDVKLQVGNGTPLPAAMASGWQQVRRIVDTQIRDAARVATGVGITTTRGYSGYLRELNPPSCARCAILAGKFYRWNAGFARHVHCDCVHVPVAGRLKDDSAELAERDPKQYFDSLSRDQQDRIFTRGGAQSIRDGADVGQVVNARRGMYTAGSRAFTREGTSVRGVAGRRLQSGGAPAAKHGGRYRTVTVPRLTPEQIYRDANGNRDEAIRLLIRFGYV